jgi:Aminopeptidase N
MCDYSEDESTIAEGYKSGFTIIYNKGAMVFRMLQHVMGNETFFRFMHEFFNEFHGKEASINDFVSLASECENLDWFFDEWLYRPGAPNYTITNVSYDGKRVTCEIRQNQEKLYKMVLEIGLMMEDGSEIRQKVWVNETAETVSFEVNEKPSKLILDPDIWVLKYYDVETEDPGTKWTYFF